MTGGLAAVGLIGLAATVWGVLAMVRDGRRMSALVVIAGGLGTAVLAFGLLLVRQDNPWLLIVGGVGALIVLLIGTVIGYPLLVVFLLWSGITVLRRESRTLGNSLALIAGIGLVVLPSTLDALAPGETVRDDFPYLARYAAHFSLVLIVAYVAVAFAVFIVASWLYRMRKLRLEPEAIIVLGSGLINGQVPPLLARRLDRGLQALHELEGRPVIIASGGQGSDESRPEAVAMREYLIEHGADPGRVVAESESANTLQNLRFSRALLSAPKAPVVVVTSSYHVFRAALLTRALGMRAHAVGAKTAWYYVPSALLREFVGVMRDHVKVHLVAVALLVLFAVLFTIILVPLMVPPPA